ncbi:MAG: PhzF family phenazine biosynthesis protein [Solirubrobacterales bacterium]
MAHRIAFLDVFAERPLAGNGLAVVLGADDLDDGTMLSFARETRLSETTFVQTATAGGADYRNRIFTVESEIPFAGHPSLGTAVAVARAAGQREAGLIQETGAGLQPIEVRIEGDRAHASMLQGPASFGEEVDAGGAMAAVGLERADGHPELPPQLVSTGLPTVIVPVAERGALSRAAPSFEAIDELLGATETPNFYLVWWDPDAARARARMFSRAVMSGEDPATGSAAGPLCAYLRERKGAREVRITQGAEMGRPSLLETAVEGNRIRVGGTVIPLIDGEVELPGPGGKIAP